MDVAGSPEPGRRLPRAVAIALAGAALAVIAVLAFRVNADVTDRRRAGFCRPDHGIAGAVGSEERTWWPLGERCRLRLADGTTRVREPGWSLTALLPTWAVVAGVGAAARAGSVRRQLAWVAVVPAVPVAALIAVVVQPHSVARLVALTAVSVGFGAVLGTISAAVVWLVARGRLLPTVLGSWLVWAVLVFVQGRDSIGP